MCNPCDEISSVEEKALWCCAQNAHCEAENDVRCPAPGKSFTCLGAAPSVDGGALHCESLGENSDGTNSVCCAADNEFLQWNALPSDCGFSERELHCFGSGDAGSECTQHVDGGASGVFCCPR